MTMYLNNLVKECHWVSTKAVLRTESYKLEPVGTYLSTLAEGPCKVSNDGLLENLPCKLLRQK